MGEEPEVADADEAVGEDVEEEADEELGGREGHGLDPVAVGVVRPPEADHAALQVHEAVGDRHAMGVASDEYEYVAKYSNVLR